MCPLSMFTWHHKEGRRCESFSGVLDDLTLQICHPVVCPDYDIGPRFMFVSAFDACSCQVSSSNRNDRPYRGESRI